MYPRVYDIGRRGERANTFGVPGVSRCDKRGGVAEEGKENEKLGTEHDRRGGEDEINPHSHSLTLDMTRIRIVFSFMSG